MEHTLDIPRDPEQEVTVPAEGLQEMLTKMFVKRGMFAAEAKIGAARLVEADLRGIHSHGSRAVELYLEALDLGNIDPRAQLLTLNETPAMAVLDGSKGLGHVAATKGMQMAIHKAREVGTGTVAIRNSQHLGAACVYVMLAVEEGMIGFCTTNTGKANVAAYGSREPATANNAFAWGVPVREGAPFVLDMACGASSWGKVKSLGLYGRSLPEGWTLDEEGNPTTDPEAAKTMLPTAGARGSALAFLCSVLAGPLVGGKMPLHKTKPLTVEASEHLLYAIDLGQFTDPDAFYEELETTMAEIRALPPEEGFDRVRLAGEAEWERAEQWRREGIPLHREHVQKLKELAGKLKVDVPW